MNNCIKDIDAVEFAMKNIEKIINVLGKVNFVFPAYKDEDLKKNYKAFAEAMARKNLIGYDQMTERNKRLTEAYELASAMREIIESLLQEIKIIKHSHGHKKKFSMAF